MYLPSDGREETGQKAGETPGLTGWFAARSLATEHEKAGLCGAGFRL